FIPLASGTYYLKLSSFNFKDEVGEASAYEIRIIDGTGGTGDPYEATLPSFRITKIGGVEVTGNNVTIPLSAFEDDEWTANTERIPAEISYSNIPSLRRIYFTRDGQSGNTSANFSGSGTLTYRLSLSPKLVAGGSATFVATMKNTFGEAVTPALTQTFTVAKAGAQSNVVRANMVTDFRAERGQDGTIKLYWTPAAPAINSVGQNLNQSYMIYRRTTNSIGTFSGGFRVPDLTASSAVDNNANLGGMPSANQTYYYWLFTEGKNYSTQNSGAATTMVAATLTGGIEIQSFNTPATATVGSGLAFSATIKNTGTAATPGLVAILDTGETGQELHTSYISALSPGGSASVNFAVRYNQAGTKSPSLMIKESVTSVSNLATKTNSVTVSANTTSAVRANTVTGLTATRSNGQIVLNWTAPAPALKADGTNLNHRYVIYRRAGTALNQYTRGKTFPITQTSFLDNGVFGTGTYDGSSLHGGPVREDTTYTYWIYTEGPNNAGDNSGAVTVTVAGGGNTVVSPTITSFTATSPTPATATLVWQTQNATMCAIGGDGIVNNQSVNGTYTFTGLGAGNRNFTLTCQGTSGSTEVSSNTNVLVEEVQNVPLQITLAGSATSVQNGTPVTLTFQSNRAPYSGEIGSCQLRANNQSIGDVAIGTSARTMTHNPTMNTNYQVTCATFFAIAGQEPNSNTFNVAVTAVAPSLFGTLTDAQVVQPYRTNDKNSSGNYFRAWLDCKTASVPTLVNKKPTNLVAYVVDPNDPTKKRDFGWGWSSGGFSHRFAYIEEGQDHPGWNTPGKFVCKDTTTNTERSVIKQCSATGCVTPSNVSGGGGVDVASSASLTQDQLASVLSAIQTLLKAMMTR
ncbi:MAG: hypothetical protein COV07_01495, partial [Candidatus Vogelbacteria bacterium CG10_big_fil_rev_8_21_14_0_10_45_14]